MEPQPTPIVGHGLSTGATPAAPGPTVKKLQHKVRPGAKRPSASERAPRVLPRTVLTSSLTPSVRELWPIKFWAFNKKRATAWEREQLGTWGQRPWKGLEEYYQIPPKNLHPPRLP